MTSTNGAVDPYRAFDITQCDTYTDLWTWDLTMSCGAGSGSDECSCTFAEQLMDMAILSCDDRVDCPANCSICNKCLRLLGCSNTLVHMGPLTAGKGTISAAVFLTALLSAGVCFARRRKRGETGTGSLEDNLMACEIERKNVWKSWIFPVEMTSDEVKPRVWLVPDYSSALESESYVSESESSFSKKGSSNERKNQDGNRFATTPTDLIRKSDSLKCMHTEGGVWLVPVDDEGDSVNEDVEINWATLCTEGDSVLSDITGSEDKFTYGSSLTGSLVSSSRVSMWTRRKALFRWWCFLCLFLSITEVMIPFEYKSSRFYWTCSFWNQFFKCDISRVVDKIWWRTPNKCSHKRSMLLEER